MDVRVFEGRTSTGVRGVRLASGDEVISMSMLRHVEAETTERDEYLAAVAAKRRLAGADYTDRDEDKKRDQGIAAKLQEERFVQNVAYFSNKFEENQEYREKDERGYITRAAEAADSIRRHLGLDEGTGLSYGGKKL